MKLVDHHGPIQAEDTSVLLGQYSSNGRERVRCAIGGENAEVGDGVPVANAFKAPSAKIGRTTAVFCDQDNEGI
jgi:hypothetical protein